MRDVGRAQEKLVNHELHASNLQAFRVFSQHPKCVIMPVKPIESVVYCFYKITLSLNYEFTATRNHRFLTNQNAGTILVILYAMCKPGENTYIPLRALYRKRKD